jgi:hypothetical protein
MMFLSAGIVIGLDRMLRPQKRSTQLPADSLIGAAPAEWPASLTMTDVNIERLAPTIFHESWWLEIATEGRYSVAEVSENGKVVGQLPYFLRKKMGLSILGLPPLTQFLGPAIVKPAKNSMQRFYITKELISKLPPTSVCYIKCHRDVQDIIAFQSAGFRSSVQFTHEIYPQPEDVIWKNVNHKGRRMIRRGGELLAFPQAMIRQPSSNSTVRASRPRVKPTGWIPLYAQGLYRRASSVIGGAYMRLRIKRATGQRAYSVRGTRWQATISWPPVIPKAIGAPQAFWCGKRLPTPRSLIFVFDGFANEGGARFAYNFTSNVTPRYIATRDSAPVRVIRAAKSIFQERDFFWWLGSGLIKPTTRAATMQTEARKLRASLS